MNSSTVREFFRSAGDDAKNLLKKADKTFMKDIDPRNKLYTITYQAYDRTLKAPYKAGIAGIAGFMAFEKLNDIQDYKSYGKITAGELSHMVGKTHSPHIQGIQSGNYNQKSIMFNREFKDTGASGDIVMALHNMR